MRDDGMKPRPLLVIRKDVDGNVPETEIDDDDTSIAAQH